MNIYLIVLLILIAPLSLFGWAIWKANQDRKEMFKRIRATKRTIDLTEGP